MKRVVWSVVGRGAIAVVMLTGISCGELTRQGESASYLILTSLEAASGAEPEEFGTVLSSDVETMIDRDGTPVPTIFGDNGRVTLSLGLKDPGPPTSPNTPSPNNFITVNRYRVTYIRADGRNTPGVDVPYPFDGGITITVSETTSAGFTLVRNQAKAEAPLAALVRNQLIISTIAEITFYGRDQTGREVSVTGRIDVHFGNFGDPQ
jgi:hypothetical protein